MTSISPKPGQAFSLGLMDGLLQPHDLTVGRIWVDHPDANEDYDRGVNIGQALGALVSPPDRLAEIVARKRAGIDCTEDESCVVMGHFDRYATAGAAEADDLAGLFPLEFDQWADEKERGLRPLTPPPPPPPNRPSVVEQSRPPVGPLLADLGLASGDGPTRWAHAARPGPRTTLTAGVLARWFAAMPPERPVLVYVGDDYHNIESLDYVPEDEATALTITAVGDYDTRQW